MKRPSFQFYPDDWLSDPALRRCSSGARGIWMDLLCVMHGGEPYGHLSTGGTSFSLAEIARVTGEAIPRVKAALAELERNGVCSRTDSGVLFSRRMTRDEDTRQRRAAGGDLGAEHGVKGGRPRTRKGFVETPSAQQEGGGERGFTGNPPSARTRAGASSSSSSSSSLNGSTARSGPDRRDSTAAEGVAPPEASPPHEPAPKRPRKAATGPLADAIRHWEAEWERTRMGQRYAIRAKDGVAFSEILKLPGVDVEEIKSRTTRLLESHDEFYLRAASPGVLASQWNQLGFELHAVGPVNGKVDPMNSWAAQELMRRRAAREAL